MWQELLDQGVPQGVQNNSPKCPIYLFTSLTEIGKHFAKLIEKKIMRRVVMDQETIESINLDDFREDYETGKRRGCLIIFDDTDRIINKVLMKKVYDLLNDALCNGEITPHKQVRLT